MRIYKITRRCMVAEIIVPFLLLIFIPGISSADWVKQNHLMLIEWGDPAFARTGTLDIWYNNTLTNPPYEYPYQVTMHVDGICNLPYTDLWSGDVFSAWLYSVITDYNSIQPYDPYSEWVAVMPYGYTGLPADGSYGQDYPIGGACSASAQARHGYLALFVRFSAYQAADDSRVPGAIHIADLLVYSFELGNEWYSVYYVP